MSGDESMLSDHDRQVLVESGVDPEPVDGSETDPDEEYITREEFEAYEEAIAKRLSRLEGRVSMLEDGDGGADDVPDHATLIEKYTAMLENGDTDIFDNQQSLRRAVEIHRNWGDWKQSLGDGETWQQGISTSKKSNRRYKPMQLKVDLEDSDIPSDSLDIKEIHRAMKMLARKSGQDEDDVEEYNDDAGRKHITGGLYEYHQRTSPDPTSHDIKHVVVRS